jgi:hypothetical protein
MGTKIVTLSKSVAFMPDILQNYKHSKAPNSSKNQLYYGF